MLKCVRETRPENPSASERLKTRSDVSASQQIKDLFMAEVAGWRKVCHLLSFSVDAARTSAVVL